MTIIETRPRADRAPTPRTPTPGGAPTPHPTMGAPTPTVWPSGGAQLAGRQGDVDAQCVNAASDQPADRQLNADAQMASAVGSEAGQDSAAGERANPMSLLDPALALAAEVLDDLERVRIANANRLRILTTSGADADGEQRGFGLDESHPDVARLAAIVDMLAKVEHDATLNLQRHMRRHPLHPWAKSMRGVGDKQVARLLAAIGDPYIRPEIVREDGTVIPSGPRTVSALWAYCGLHVLPASGPPPRGTRDLTAAGQDQLPGTQSTFDNQKEHDAGNGGDPGQSISDIRRTAVGVAPKRTRGQRANWSTTAKTKALLIAMSCLKQLVKPCTGEAHTDDCRCSPYRVVYDRRRAHTASTHPDWTDGHSHNDALRVAAKELMKHLWREAKRIHELPERAA